MITVCAACGSASCWEGRLVCEDYRTASTIDVSRPCSMERHRHCAESLRCECRCHA